MKLEVGKTYLDNLDRRVKIIEKVRGTEFCYVGEKVVSGEVCRYKEDGSYAYMKTPYCLCKELEG